ncbi:MAG: oligoendopeptidase F family protein [bacterium]|nr:oligoendopeptidase F family protein [bacterium]
MLDVDIPAPILTMPDGKKYTLNLKTYTELRESKNHLLRRSAIKTFNSNLKKYQNIFAVLFDGAMKLDVFYAKTANYKSALESRMKGEKLEPEMFFNAILQVRQNTGPLHRYLKLKKKLLGPETMDLSEVNISPLPDIKTLYSFAEARGMVLGSVKPPGEQYMKWMTMAFENRWLDRYPHKNKRNFGYSSDVHGVHPFVLLNYTGAFHDIYVMAHELGHSMHSMFTNKDQHFQQRMYAGMLAETTAHFNEHMLISYLMEKEKDDLMKFYVLDKCVLGIINAVYNQIRYAEFEHAMHLEAEAGRTLTADWLNKKFLELARIYYGEDKGICRISPIS